MEQDHRLFADPEHNFAKNRQLPDKRSAQALREAVFSSGVLLFAEHGENRAFRDDPEEICGLRESKRLYPREDRRISSDSGTTPKKHGLFLRSLVDRHGQCWLFPE